MVVLGVQDEGIADRDQKNLVNCPGSVVSHDENTAKQSDSEINRWEEQTERKPEEETDVK